MAKTPTIVEVGDYISIGTSHRVDVGTIGGSPVYKVYELRELSADAKAHSTETHRWIKIHEVISKEEAIEYASGLAK